MKQVQVVILSLLMVALVGCQKEETVWPYEEQLQRDIAAIDNYLTRNNIEAKVDSTNTLRYVITKPSEGLKPAQEDSITVLYTYSILKDNELGQSATTAEPLTFLLSNLIEGWRRILPLVGEGSNVTIYIPSGLAYGAYQQGRIPPNSNLVFDIELVKVIPEFSRQLAKDVKTIDDYIKSNNLTAKKDASGLSYTILSPGAGAVASLADTVSVIYKGTFLDQTVFDQSLEPKKFRLSKTIRAWQIGLLQLQKGGRILLYVPSGLAYGAYGTNKTQVPVPVAANLIYDLQLVDIKKN